MYMLLYLNLKNESHMIASHCCRMLIVIVVGVLRKRRENTSDQITIRSSFECDWLRRWRELSGPITRLS